MNKTKIKYSPRLKEKAKLLRKNSTLSEVLLWKYLKGKQMKGYDFHRQKPIDNYIVDFFCPKLMLAIEIDGYTHDSNYAYDQAREMQLKKLGISFLRFTDIEIKQNIEGVLTAIEDYIIKVPSRKRGGTEGDGVCDIREC